jgi:hypothetical protein
MPTNSVGCGVGIGHVQTSLEQVFCKGVNAVDWLTLAYVQKTISKDRHQVVKKVCPNRL